MTYHLSPGQETLKFCGVMNDELGALRFEAVFDDSATCCAGKDGECFGVAGARVRDCTAGTISYEPPSSSCWGNRPPTLVNGSEPANIWVTRSVKSWNLIFPSVTKEQD